MSAAVVEMSRSLESIWAFMAAFDCFTRNMPRKTLAIMRKAESKSRAFVVSLSFMPFCFYPYRIPQHMNLQ
jgi:hypothetical protein